MFWLKTECLSVEKELCELICINCFPALSLIEPFTAGVKIYYSKIRSLYFCLFFVYLYLAFLPDTFFLQIIYFLDGKEANLAVCLENKVETENKK